jgi:uncharacterized GH25 family protein
MKKFLAATIVIVAASAIALAHDTWVQPNTNLVRVGDAVYVDLLLGNHGNAHRDFKVAGKATPESCTLDVIGPDGKRFDLKPSLTDQGYAPKEGFWNARFIPAAAGMYLVAQTMDKVVDYAPERSIKSAKTYFVASKSLDKPPTENGGYDRVLGHPLELVPQTNPVTPMGPGTKLTVKLIYKGKPLAGEVVSFIPRGVQLSESFDPRYERKTNEKGEASFEPTEANYYLIVAHRHEPSEAGKGYTSTKYAATLCLYVPAICPCCGD